MDSGGGHSRRACWALIDLVFSVCNIAAYAVFRLSTSVLLFTVLGVLYMWHISRNARVLVLLLWSTILVFSRLNLCWWVIQCSIIAVLFLRSSICGSLVLDFSSVSNLFMCDWCPDFLWLSLFYLLFVYLSTDKNVYPNDT